MHWQGGACPGASSHLVPSEGRSVWYTYTHTSRVQPRTRVSLGAHQTSAKRGTDPVTGLTQTVLSVGLPLVGVGERPGSPLDASQLTQISARNGSCRLGSSVIVARRSRCNRRSESCQAE
ncbi:unnamed protein product [Protopolystoma xenopodis]|uniref:Uncharacterized protein n=1 Tax=Protopolystoma xenopodis TaxID=117903 RepID=A0A3S5CL37_9PLAT|nr:unnamed protein product [Protopolystoma xenopodis]